MLNGIGGGMGWYWVVHWNNEWWGLAMGAILMGHGWHNIGGGMATGNYGPHSWVMGGIMGGDMATGNYGPHPWAITSHHGPWVTSKVKAALA